MDMKVGATQGNNKGKNACNTHFIDVYVLFSFCVKVILLF
jgi:hypothetical protein